MKSHDWTMTNQIAPGEMYVLAAFPGRFVYF